jgi:hypothetical protein
MNTPTPQWEPLSFLDNLNAAANHLGYANLPIAWGLATVAWPDLETRDAVFMSLVNTRPR